MDSVVVRAEVLSEGHQKFAKLKKKTEGFRTTNLNPYSRILKNHSVHVILPPPVQSSYSLWPLPRLRGALELAGPAARRMVWDSWRGAATHPGAAVTGWQDDPWEWTYGTYTEKQNRSVVLKGACVCIMGLLSKWIWFCFSVKRKQAEW